MIRVIILPLVFLCMTVTCQKCDGMFQYDRCSSNPLCHCLHLTGDVSGNGICVLEQLIFTELVSCQSPHNLCYSPEDICVHHPVYRDHPVCFPKSEIDPRICPPIHVTSSINTTMISISTTTSSIRTTTREVHLKKKWRQNGITIAGGNGRGNQLNQLSNPQGLYIDKNGQSIYISDRDNDRIVAWKYGASYGEVVTGENQLNAPRDVLVDHWSDSLIICDRGNRRVVQWSRQNRTQRQMIIDNIDCWYLSMDHNGNLYVSDGVKNEVKRWNRGENNGTTIAGGHGRGDRLNQFDIPTYIYVDTNETLYASDELNHRVVKWIKGSKEGIVIAGGHGEGNSSLQLSHPHGMTVDQWGDLYVSDTGNNRVMCWSKGSNEGHLIVGGNGIGEQSNQLVGPRGLAFDEERNLHVVDMGNHRVQKFILDKD